MLREAEDMLGEEDELTERVRLLWGLTVSKAKGPSDGEAALAPLVLRAT